MVHVCLSIRDVYTKSSQVSSCSIQLSLGRQCLIGRKLDPTTKSGWLKLVPQILQLILGGHSEPHCLQKLSSKQKDVQQYICTGIIRQLREKLIVSFDKNSVAMLKWLSSGQIVNEQLYLETLFKFRELDREEVDFIEKLCRRTFSIKAMLQLTLFYR